MTAVPWHFKRDGQIGCIHGHPGFCWRCEELRILVEASRSNCCGGCKAVTEHAPAMRELAGVEGVLTGIVTGQQAELTAEKDPAITVTLDGSTLADVVAGGAAPTSPPAKRGPGRPRKAPAG